MKWSRAAISVAALAIVPGCTGGGSADPSASTAAAPTLAPTASTDPSATSTATSTPTSPATSPDEGSESPAVASFVADPDARGPLPDGDFSIEACRWTSIGEYELDVRWTPAAAGGTAAEVSIELAVSPTVRSRPGIVGVITLPAAGTFTVPVGLPVPVVAEEDAVARAFRPDVEIPTGATCSIAVLDDEIFRPEQLALDIEPGPARNAPAGSLQAVAGSDLALLPAAGVVQQLEQVGALPFDRLWVAPATRLDSIEVFVEGTCTRVEQAYDVTSSDGTQTERIWVAQSRGCIDPFPPGASERVLRVVDPTWQVLVIGGAETTDQVAGRLVGYAVAGAEAVTGPPEPNADDWFAGYVEERPALRIVARFPWRDGEVAVVEDTTARADSRFMEPVVFTLEGFNAGGGGLGCRQFTVVERDDEVDGFRYFVAGSPDLVFSTPLADGTTHVAELAEFEPGLWVGFLDHAEVLREIVDAGGFPYRMLAQTEVTNPDGSDAHCTQG